MNAGAGRGVCKVFYFKLGNVGLKTVQMLFRD